MHTKKNQIHRSFKDVHPFSGEALKKWIREQLNWSPTAFLGSFRSKYEMRDQVKVLL
jgi:hypothetical protein